MYNDLLMSFGADEGMEPDNYPEYFGGAYINEKGDFVVKIESSFYDKQRSGIEREIEISVKSKNFITETATYSFEYLTTTLETLSEYLINNPESEITKNVSGAMIVDDKNIILIELYDASQVNVDKVKSLFKESSSITFSETSEGLCLETNLNPGALLRSAYTGYYGSVAYRVKKNGIAGFITAAYSKAGNVNSALGVTRY
ncbi:MAG: hypothetical protein LBQ95_04095 [Lachnospiraceae bacterium]|jgi:hypothetical protein|nr:hypothetical protein [Lachnospiraceae bacterium]